MNGSHLHGSVHWRSAVEVPPAEFQTATKRVRSRDYTFGNIAVRCDIAYDRVPDFFARNSLFALWGRALFRDEQRHRRRDFVKLRKITLIYRQRDAAAGILIQQGLADRNIHKGF
jgi:hypothetical protein